MFHFTHGTGWMRDRLSELGINQNLTLMTAWGFYRKTDEGYDYSRVDEETCERVAAKKDWTGPICLDIEAFDFADPKFDLHTEQFEIALKSYRKHNPGKRIGFYRYIPFREYWVPVRYRSVSSDDFDYQKYRDDWLAWRRKNARHRSEQRDGNRVGNRGLADQVDVVFPSLYTFYSSIDDWLKYANENLIEAAKYQKPILAWLWPVYHGSNREGFAGHYIGGDFLRKQLEMCRDHGVEGICWFGTDTEDIDQDEWTSIVREFAG